MDYEEKVKKAEEHAKRVKEKQDLKQIWHKYDVRKKIPTSKLILLYMAFVLNIVLGYAMWSMIYLQDLSALPVLISDIASQVLLVIVYYCKSTIENRSGGIVFESAIREIEARLDQSGETGDDAVG